eukprot:1964006-Pleurochrysis_carterae.AAC.1
MRSGDELERGWETLEGNRVGREGRETGCEIGDREEKGKGREQKWRTRGERERHVDMDRGYGSGAWGTLTQSAANPCSRWGAETERLIDIPAALSLGMRGRS